MEEEIIILLDEFGKEKEFILLASFGVDEDDYAALLPVEDGEDEVYLLKIEVDENGDNILVGIEDEEELKEIIEIYEELQGENLQ